MKQKHLNWFLNELSETEFRQVELRIQLGRSLRDMEINYKIPVQEMARKLELDQLEYCKWRSGAINFNVTQIAKINVLLGSLIRKKAEEKDLIKIKLDEEKEK